MGGGGGGGREGMALNHGSTFLGGTLRNQRSYVRIPVCESAMCVNVHIYMQPWDQMNPQIGIMYPILL